MRHAPLGVDRVAVKPSTDVIAHAAERHRAKRFRRHEQRRLRAAASDPPSRVLAQQEQELRGTRKLRGLAEPAVAGVERHLELLDGDVERLRVRDRRFGPRRAARRRHQLQPIEQLAGRVVHARSILFPHSRRARQADRGILASPSVMSEGNRCRRRTASAPESETPSSASRPSRWWPARRPCRRDRRRGVPRDPP